MTAPSPPPAVDWAEFAARTNAHALAICDHGSARAILNVAALLRDAYKRGRDDVEIERRAAISSATPGGETGT